MDFDLIHNLNIGFGVALSLQNLVLLLRRAAGDDDRSAARHRADRHHRHAAADDVQPVADFGADHARRHLLRRTIRRLDHGNPGQYSGRVVLGDHLSRWL